SSPRPPPRSPLFPYTTLFRSPATVAPARCAARPTEAPISPVPTIAICTSGSVREFVRAWAAKTEQDKDAGRPRTQRYGADRRSHATVCSRPGTQRNLRMGPLTPHELGQAEREVERLPRVQARIAERLVAVVEVLLGQLLRAAEALGHVLARVLEVHAARPDPLDAAGGEEPLELGHDRVEVARLVAAGEE